MNWTLKIPKPDHPRHPMEIAGEYAAKRGRKVIDGTIKQEWMALEGELWINFDMTDGEVSG